MISVSNQPISSLIFGRAEAVNHWILRFLFFCSCSCIGIGLLFSCIGLFLSFSFILFSFCFFGCGSFWRLGFTIGFGLFFGLFFSLSCWLTCLRLFYFCLSLWVSRSCVILNLDFLVFRLHIIDRSRRRACILFNGNFSWVLIGCSSVFFLLFLYDRRLWSGLFKSIGRNLLCQAFRNLVNKRLLLIQHGSLATFTNLAIISDNDNWLDIDRCSRILLDLLAHLEMRDFNSLIILTALVFPDSSVLPFFIFFAPLIGNFSCNFFSFFSHRLVCVEIDFRVNELGFRGWSSGCYWLLRGDKLTIVFSLKRRFRGISRNFASVILGANLSHSYLLLGLHLACSVSVSI